MSRLKGLSTSTRVFFGEGHEPASQLLLIVTGQRDLEALGDVVLADHTTGTSFFCPERFLKHDHCSTAGARG